MTCALPHSPLAVLLVEDEPLVRLAGERAIQAMGYRSSVAANGREALNLLAADPAIDVMITDMHLSGMNGRELAAEASRIHPRLKILLSTGSEPHMSGDCALPVLLKPYLEEDLAKAIRDLAAA
jgi:CheY-like chemotaxis protein